MNRRTPHGADQNRWKMAAEIAGLGIWETSFDMADRYFSDAWFDLRGAQRTEDFSTVWDYEDWMARIHPDDRDNARRVTSDLYAGRAEAISHAFRELHAAGHYIWVASQGKAIAWSAEGKPTRFLGTDTDVTQLKESEKATANLRDDQLRLQAAVESANLGVWDVDGRTGRRLHSKGWRTMRGHDPDSTYGDTQAEWLEDVHPDDRAKMIRQSEEFRTTELNGTISNHYRQRRKDNSWMWVLSQGRVVERDENGLSMREVGIDADITRLMGKEAALSRLSGTLELAVSASNMGVWESYSETGEALWDDRVRDIYGLYSDDPIVTPELFKSFIHPDDLHIVEQEADLPYAAGEDFHTTFRIVHPERGIRHIEVRAKHQQNIDSGPRHVGVVQDITEKVHREEVLTETNRLLDDVLQRMEQGIAMFQGETLQDSVLVLSNDKFYDMLELPRPPEGTQMTFARYIAHIQDFIEWPEEGITSLSMLLATAEIGTIAHSLLRLPSGRVIGVVGTGQGLTSRIVTFTDMTDLIQSENRRAELAASVSHLHRLQALGNLTGGIAHDFNNLLAVIAGNADLIMEAPTDQRQFVEAIQASVDRGAQLTQRLLAFARKQPLQPVSIGIDQLFSNLSSLLVRTLGDEVSLAIKIDGGIWNVHADQSQLENALINLAVNARDALPGGGTIRFTAKNVVRTAQSLPVLEGVPPGDYVRIEVQDDGCGMAPDVLEHVFEPFYTTKDVGKGSGLGLSMVFGFARQSGGDVVIDSTLGAGTKVTMFLPRDANAEMPAPPPEIGPLKYGNKEKILLVEDDPSVLQMIKMALIALNYDVVSVPDAAQAMTVLNNRGGDFDLLLTDIALPGGVNGFELGAQAAALFPDLKALYTSGYVERHQTTETLSDQVDFFIAKPFTVQDLSAAVQAALIGVPQR